VIRDTESALLFVAIVVVAIVLMPLLFQLLMMVTA